MVIENSKALLLQVATLGASGAEPDRSNGRERLQRKNHGARQMRRAARGPPG